MDLGHGSHLRATLFTQEEGAKRNVELVWMPWDPSGLAWTPPGAQCLGAQEAIASD